MHLGVHGSHTHVVAVPDGVGRVGLTRRVGSESQGVGSMMTFRPVRRAAWPNAAAASSSG